ncbi:hypothetical protein QBC34DRAFT_386187 [Podospora aff. communis PSN243]|uniref:RING-type domain-containing protein n=1 Tax=Podospora aff. communis PSN243 TaxID=3040156 RepID=A0AAV9G622_9PEZI|nr:hypothetical protein QBC34DRAFT_386187 [Podospora aff. communis PSN243]
MATPTLWRDLKSHILSPSPSSGPPPTIPCTLCQSTHESLIPGLHAPTNRTSTTTKEPAHGVVILPCGHMFGSTCWDSLVERASRASIPGRYLKCPNCMSGLKFSRECAHSAEAHKLDLGIDVNDDWDVEEARELLLAAVGMVPLTHSEGRDSISGICGTCFRERACEGEGVAEKLRGELVDVLGTDAVSGLSDARILELTERLDRVRHGVPWMGMVVEEPPVEVVPPVSTLEDFDVERRRLRDLLPTERADRSATSEPARRVADFFRRRREDAARREAEQERQRERELRREQRRARRVSFYLSLLSG